MFISRLLETPEALRTFTDKSFTTERERNEAIAKVTVVIATLVVHVEKRGKAFATY